MNKWISGLPVKLEYETGWAALILAAGWAYEKWDLLAYQEPGRSSAASGGTGGSQEWLATFFSDFLSGSLAVSWAAQSVV